MLFPVLGKTGRERARGAKSDRESERGGVLEHAFKFASLFVHAIDRRLQFRTLASAV